MVQAKAGERGGLLTGDGKLTGDVTGSVVTIGLPLSLEDTLITLEAFDLF